MNTCVLFGVKRKVFQGDGALAKAATEKENAHHRNWKESGMAELWDIDADLETEIKKSELYPVENVKKH